MDIGVEDLSQLDEQNRGDKFALHNHTRTGSGTALDEIHLKVPPLVAFLSNAFSRCEVAHCTSYLSALVSPDPLASKRLKSLSGTPPP